jgi:hypothetical protein
MAATLTQPTRHLDSERERLRRRRDRHLRLETDRALTEVAFMLRARERRSRGLDHGVGHELDVREERPAYSCPTESAIVLSADRR